MRYRTIVTLLVLVLSTFTYGETEKEKAHDLGMQAIKVMDAGKIEEAITLLEEAKELDPENIDYPYEIALAHYLDKDYKMAISILKELTKHPQCTDRIYQMLGNACDMYGDREKAIKVYNLGLKKFPMSGVLYLERGGMEYVKENDKGALEYYEKGIQVDPEFPSNYYWASRLYLGSTEKVWGMLYGEIFMNLERGSARTAEISKLLYDTYKSQIQFKSEDSFSIDFSRNSTITINPGADPEQMKLPYPIGAYEPVLAASVAGEKAITLDALHRIREKFLDIYYSRKLPEIYPNVLFEYQRNIKNAGYLEAYNHWLLMKGNEDEFGQWIEGKEGDYENFTAWFSENPIEINSKNKFYSGQYN